MLQLEECIFLNSLIFLKIDFSTDKIVRFKNFKNNKLNRKKNSITTNLLRH